MSRDDYVLRCLSFLRPRAKFVVSTHSSEFIDSTANLGDGFHSVYLYDEQIDSNVILGARGPIMIHNSYLASFAYNLLLCWLFRAEHGEAGPSNLELGQLLKHNFKKYFAEQLLSIRNSIFTRAIFLETLLFEQVRMVPVFNAKSQNAELNRNATLGSELMSSVLSSHELGHFYLARDPQIWDDLLSEYADVCRDLFTQVSVQNPALFVEEFKCDAIAVFSCLRQFEEKMGRKFCLRAIVFAFAAFAVLFSLTKSAKATAKAQENISDDVNFESIEKKQIDYEYAIEIDSEFIKRSELVFSLCHGIAMRENLDIFGHDGPFPLPVTILDNLMLYVENVMESDDQNAREMSLLAAEAFHEHPLGMQFLKLRSKTFSFGSQWNATGTLKEGN